MMLGRRGATVAAAVVSALLGLGGTAWACTSQARIVAVSSESGPPRSEVTVRGQAVAAGQGNVVEMRWNGVRGPLMGTGVRSAGGDFTAQATIPEAAPGIYSIVIVSGDTGVGRTAFEVTPTLGTSKAAVGTTADGWPRFSSAPEPASSRDSLVAGVALLGAGLVLLFSGFTVAAVRRRRART